jgi:hypothetical protein
VLKQSTIAPLDRVSIYILVVSSLVPVAGYQIMTLGFLSSMNRINRRPIPRCLI